MKTAQKNHYDSYNAKLRIAEAKLRELQDQHDASELFKTEHENEAACDAQVAASYQEVRRLESTVYEGNFETYENWYKGVIPSPLKKQLNEMGYDDDIIRLALNKLKDAKWLSLMESSECERAKRTYNECVMRKNKCISKEHENLHASIEKAMRDVTILKHTLEQIEHSFTRWWKKHEEKRKEDQAYQMQHAQINQCEKVISMLKKVNP